MVIGDFESPRSVSDLIADAGIQAQEIVAALLFEDHHNSMEVLLAKIRQEVRAAVLLHEESDPRSPQTPVAMLWWPATSFQPDPCIPAPISNPCLLDLPNPHPKSPVVPFDRTVTVGIAPKGEL